MSTRFRLLMPRHVHEEMIAQARAELPNECCGFLAGCWEDAAGQRVARVVGRYPLVNEAADARIEYLAERSLFPAVREILRAGLDIVAIYHSHPTSDPVPSRKDRERNYYGPEVVHLIVSLATNEPEVRAWRLTENEAESLSWHITDDSQKRG